MKAVWKLWSEALPAEWCERLISQAKDVPAQESLIGFGETARRDPMRRSRIRWLDCTDPGWDWVRRDVMNFFLMANSEVFGFEICWLPHLQFTEYREEDKGHYNWHRDVDWVSEGPMQRKLSLVAQLSELNDYEGGDFQLEEESPSGQILRKRGTVLVFPSFLKHKVTPVTSGLRQSLVCWIEGPNFR